MYTNPSRFAPKVRKAGGEAYPQAPTMNQFFDYGRPTPQTPFVFQNGGMNDIQKMNSQSKNHYASANKPMFDQPSNRIADFLNKIKERSYKAVEDEMGQDQMMLDEGYDMAANQMDAAYMQWGGSWSDDYDVNFDTANAWGDQLNNTGDTMGALQDFAGVFDAYNQNPDEYYVKKMKYDFTPAAKYGQELKEFQGDFGSSQYNRDAAVANAERLRNLPAGSRGPLPNPFQMFNVPGATPITRGGRKITIDRDAPIGMPDYYTGQNSFEGYIPADRQRAITFQQSGNKPFSPDFNPWAGFQTSGNNAPFPFITQDAYQEQQQENQKRKSQTPAATTKNKTTTSTTTTQTNGNQTTSGTQTGTDAAKTDEKPKDAETPKAGTEPTTPTTPTTPAAAENKTPEQIQQEAASAGMSPQQYMTFLRHAEIKMGPLGRRLRRASFDFDMYGPGMNPVTASVPGGNRGSQTADNGQENGSEDVPGGRNNQQNNQRGDGFFRRLFGRPDEQSKWNTENDVKRFSSRVKNTEAPVMESQFETQGYADKNYLSDLRNERATNKLNRLGQRIDRNMQREQALDKFYQAPISDRMQRLRDRDLRKYNRLARRFDRDEYVAPAFAYGGGMGYFQGDEGSSEVFDEGMFENYTGESFGDSAGLNYDMTGTAKDPNEMGLVGKGKLDYKFGKKSNPYAGELALAGLNALRIGLHNRDINKNKNIFRDKMGADQVFTKMNDMSKGDYTMNEGYFRPNQQVPVQFSGYNFESPYAKMGGSYKKGGEYYLSDAEIQRIIDMGGEVEFLED